MSNTQEVTEQPWHKSNEHWRFTVEVNKHTGKHEARLPQRPIACEGNSRDEAIANLIRCYCELARKGALDPVDPNSPGAPPVQHTMEILTEHLAQNVAQRDADRNLHGHDEDNVQRARSLNTTGGGARTNDPRFLRRNEVISGLGTAIAALARIKEL